MSVKAPLRAIDGAAKGEIDLPEIFAEGPRDHLIYEVVRMQQAQRRAGTHATKTRHFVSGGGAKPWKQKGTGRARAGSSRSPLWEGGAVVFGPQPRDYSYSLPAKARKVAIKAALSDRQRLGALTIVEGIELATPKTKSVVAMLSKLELKGSTLIVAGSGEQPNDALELGARNIPQVKVLRAEGVNVLDVIRHKNLVLTSDAVEALVERLSA